jgi:glycerol-3-phosphate dehydrogenase
LTPREALRLEPHLNPDLKAAVRVPDGSFDAMRVPLRFFATAIQNGATIQPYTEVTGLLVHNRLVSGAVVRDHITGASGEIHAANRPPSQCRSSSWLTLPSSSTEPDRSSTPSSPS